MKKTLLSLLAILLCFSFTACNKSAENSSAQNGATPNEAEQVTSYVELTAENTIVIEGQSYALPMPAATLLNNGWNDTYDAMKEEIESEKAKKYPAFGLDNGGKEKIKGVGYYNPDSEKTTLDKCAVVSLDLVGTIEEQSYEKCSFTLPGGITENSTYTDVLAVYGSKTEPKDYRVTDDYEAKKQNSENFSKHGFSVIYTPTDNNAAPYKYIFFFNADESIKYVSVESVNYQSDALAAFKK